MKDKLRELAERWKAEYSGIAGAEIGTVHVTQCTCADELLAILDAEGDGGAVGGVNPDELYAQLTPFADPVCGDCDGRGVFYGNVCVCGCVMTKLQATHPARSGVVRDEDVDLAVLAHHTWCKDAGFTGYVTCRGAMRAALEHFVKGERHER